MKVCWLQLPLGSYPTVRPHPCQSLLTILRRALEKFTLKMNDLFWLTALSFHCNISWRHCMDLWWGRIPSVGACGRGGCSPHGGSASRKKSPPGRNQGTAAPRHVTGDLFHWAMPPIWEFHTSQTSYQIMKPLVDKSSDESRALRAQSLPQSIAEGQALNMWNLMVGKHHSTFDAQPSLLQFSLL